MEMVDSRNRWVYKGSVTTPPCATTVYWNLMSTIYPIKAEHLEKFRTGSGDVMANENWRLTNVIDLHDVRYITDD